MGRVSRIKMWTEIDFAIFRWGPLDDYDDGPR